MSPNRIPVTNERAAVNTAIDGPTLEAPPTPRLAVRSPGVIASRARNPACPLLSPGHLPGWPAADFPSAIVEQSAYARCRLLPGYQFRVDVPRPGRAEDSRRSSTRSATPAPPRQAESAARDECRRSSPVAEVSHG